MTRRLRTDQRGAVLLLVGIAMIGVLATMALVIDMGRNLSERRRLVTATDAAALAAARAFSLGDDGCGVPDDDFLARNAADATLIGCRASGDTVGGSWGWVIVDADLAVDQTLAGIIGIDSVTVSSSSVAAFGIPSDRFEGGARPMGLCLEGLLGSPVYQTWQNTDPTVPSDRIRLDYTKEHPDACGDTKGTWGFIDFDGGSNSNTETIDWIEFGYPGTVSPRWYEGDVGAISNSHRRALQSLVDSADLFWLPVFTEALGSGAQTDFHVTTFLAVRMTGFKVAGPEGDRYLEFVIDPQGLQAGCCAAPGSFDNGSRVTSLTTLSPDGTPYGVDL